MTRRNPDWYQSAHEHVDLNDPATYTDTWFPKKYLAWDVHDLRHEATSRLFEAGYSIVEVQQFTLHDSWGTLSRYTHLRPVKCRNTKRWLATETVAHAFFQASNDSLWPTAADHNKQPFE